MFRKIVSNLSFSPALVHQLGFYAKRLRKEEASRRLGLIFTALALVVQSLMVFQAPESANAANSNDFVRGGISSLDEYLKAYDKNSNNIKDVFDQFGITRDEISDAKYGSWEAKGTMSWGFESRFSYSQGERKVKVVDEDGKFVKYVYGRPMDLYSSYDTKKVYGWIGKSDKVGWFAIIKTCGNLATKKVPPPPPEKCPYNPAIEASDEKCKPCPGQDDVWIDDPDCVAEITRNKTATNISRGSIDATSQVARESDLIRYVLTVENKGLASKSITVKENLKDILEYSKLVDDGGGIYDKDNYTLEWPSITLAQNEKQVRVLAVRLLDKTPTTPRGQSEPSSFDCTMTNVFGNQVDVKVKCPEQKIVETVAEQLPETGPTENMIFGGTLLAVVTYFYMRSRQLKTEIRLMRKTLNSGAI